MKTEKVYQMTFSSIYPMYVQKVERKERTEEELKEVLSWLTGYSEKEIVELAKIEVTLEEFFDRATLNPARENITGSICGVKIQEIEESLMKEIRYMDKVVDELAKGKKIEKIMRS